MRQVAWLAAFVVLACSSLAHAQSGVQIDQARKIAAERIRHVPKGKIVSIISNRDGSHYCGMAAIPHFGGTTAFIVNHVNGGWSAWLPVGLKKDSKRVDDIVAKAQPGLHQLCQGNGVNF